ncbi:hypothetical protein CLV65_1560 [Pseudoscardovia suis]|uniref:Uncharacterized protein n=2 Tax=Pseudoscardovia suis TaxID=987063 RepID=A0A261EPV3_9BIFI|nr:hypothetical protein PSSU_1705 [Pseudoscardovia suis]PJJ63937.1 hypothetical protein CLV65_1560 [Pseudoscardovia suis]
MLAHPMITSTGVTITFTDPTAPSVTFTTRQLLHHWHGHGMPTPYDWDTLLIHALDTRLTCHRTGAWDAACRAYHLDPLAQADA